MKVLHIKVQDQGTIAEFNIEVEEGKQGGFIRWLDGQLEDYAAKTGGPDEDNSILSPELREKIVEQLIDTRLNGSFGDGMEREYILNGCTMVGLNEMTDEELINEYEEDVADGDDEDEIMNEIRSVQSRQGIVSALENDERDN